MAPFDSDLSLRTSGRYHRGLDLFRPDQVWPVLYTSLAPEIAVWEMVRRRAARDLTYLRNSVLTEIDVDLATVLDLSDPTTARFRPAELTSADRRLCQELAAAAVVNGYGALLVPSATLPGLNLVNFPRNLSDPPPIRVVRSTELPLDDGAAEER